MATSYNKKMVKRLNQRLLTFEKEGLTNSAQYDYIIEQAKLHGALTQSKTGKLRISESTNMSASDLNKLAKTKTAGKLISEKTKQMRAEGENPTREEVIEVLNEEGSLRKWISDNLEFVYYMEKENVHASTILSMLKAGGRKFTYSQFWDRIHEYEKRNKQWEDQTGKKVEDMQYLPHVSGVYEEGGSRFDSDNDLPF